MNCYEVSNPKDGQQCQDDVLGTVVYNASDATWEKHEGYTNNNGNVSFDLSTLPGNKKNNAATTADSILSKYGIYIAGGVAFLLAILLLNYFKK